jgi:hypothetical protein
MVPRKESPLGLLLQLPELKSPVGDAVRPGRAPGWTVLSRLQTIREARNRSSTRSASRCRTRIPRCGRSAPSGSTSKNLRRALNLAFEWAAVSHWAHLDPLFPALALDGLGDRSRGWLDEQALFLCPSSASSRRPSAFRTSAAPGAKLPEVGSIHRFWKESVSSTLNRLTRANPSCRSFRSA